MITRIRWAVTRCTLALLVAVDAACVALNARQRKASYWLTSALTSLSRHAREAQLGRGEALPIQTAVRRGGSSGDFAKLFELRHGRSIPPMHLEHGVTHAKNHDAFTLNNAISSEPLSKAEHEAMARALSGGSTEHIR